MLSAYFFLFSVVVTRIGFFFTQMHLYLQGDITSRLYIKRYCTLEKCRYQLHIDHKETKYKTVNRDIREN